MTEQKFKNKNDFNRMPFVMRLPFSHKQMENLAKVLGVKWTYPVSKTIPKEKIEVQPLPPPTGKLYYIGPKYNNNDKSDIQKQAK